MGQAQDGAQRLYEDDLFELYLGMTENAGHKRGLTAAMHDADIKKIPTTKEGRKAYYYKVPTLRYHVIQDGGFSPIEIDLEE